MRKAGAAELSPGQQLLLVKNNDGFYWEKNCSLTAEKEFYLSQNCRFCLLMATLKKKKTTNLKKTAYRKLLSSPRLEENEGI